MGAGFKYLGHRDDDDTDDVKVKLKTRRRGWQIPNAKV